MRAIRSFFLSLSLPLLSLSILYFSLSHNSCLFLSLYLFFNDLSYRISTGIGLLLPALLTEPLRMSKLQHHSQKLLSTSAQMHSALLGEAMHEAVGAAMMGLDQRLADTVRV